MKTSSRLIANSDRRQGKLHVRFWIFANELPRITDASGALASRFVLLTLRNSFLGREDLQPTEKLSLSSQASLTTP